MDKLILLVVLPLLAAFLMPVIARYSELFARLFALAVLSASIAIIINVWPQINQQAVSFAIGGFSAPLGIVFYVDQVSLFFALLIPLMMLIFWPWNKDTHIREYSLLMLLTASASGMILSGDLFNIYVFYELLAVSSYGLVAVQALNSQTKTAAIAAALRYLFLGAVGSVMMLLGIAIVYMQTGTLNLAHLALLSPEKLNNIPGLSAFALILIGMGVKAELFPVNTWVSEVYSSVSTRLSALMAGLLSKLAVIVIIRLLILLFPQTEALHLMTVLGILAVLTGELIAWRAQDMIRMLSFSSIAQLGLVFIAFSLPGEVGVFAGIAMSLHHLVIKPALFMLADAWSGSLEQLAGAAKQSPLAVTVFIVLILSLLGVPPFPGFWVKMLIMVNLALAGDTIYSIAIAVIVLATVIEIAYLFRLVMKFYQPVESAKKFHHKPYELAIASSAMCIILIAIFNINTIESKLRSMAMQMSDRQYYIYTVFSFDDTKKPALSLTEDMK